LKDSKRDEKEIFYDLNLLCSTPGYAHVIAYFCFKDNLIRFTEKIKTGDLEHQYSDDRLVRTEISTLVGLMIKHKLDFSMPLPNTMQYLIEKTETLLEETHSSMITPIIDNIKNSNIFTKDLKPFANGLAMREPIFYGGESAYSFQYRDFSIKKYSSDNEWLKANKGFYIEEAKEVILCLIDIQIKKLNTYIKEFEQIKPEHWTMLPAYIFNIEEIVNETDLKPSTIYNVLKAFALPKEVHNQEFSTINDFNISNAYPIITLENDKYLLFQYYSIVEALYETPFYWLCNDKNYLNEAMKNRGDFAENFSKERLEIVFGKNRVFSNINIMDSKNKVIGEIDVLVVFSNRAIILQAKSKRLTIEARKGNDNKIKDDFKKSIQDSYNQALLCANLLDDCNYRLIGSNSNEITINRVFKEIYIFCVVSDHYPALSFQTQEFLKYEQSEKIMPPFVMDIFLLDAMTEMLNSPLHLLSYINKRALYYDKIVASNELTILSYHLKQNLLMDSKYSSFYLCEDISEDLDIAMIVRRDGVPGNDTPDGTLTRIKNTHIGRLIEEIEKTEDPVAIDFGFELLQLSEDTVYKISDNIETMAMNAKCDGKHHNFSVLIDEGRTGFTFHFNDIVNSDNIKLLHHCEIKKYSQKAMSWFGISIVPQNLALKFVLSLEYKWEYSQDMQNAVKNFNNYKTIINCSTIQVEKQRKIGRNESCPCGSGLKYKKCCIDR